MTSIEHTEIQLGTPVIELGENRYLRHFVYEVFHRGEFAGHLFATRYAYSDVSDDKVLRSWMARPDTYTDHNQQFMLDPASKYSALPVELAEALSHNTGSVLYLDEVTMSPEFRNAGVEEAAIALFSSQTAGEHDGIIVPDYSAMARYIKGIYITPESFWSKLGFKVIGNHLLVSEGSITTGNQDSERHQIERDR